jgi:hypothetical protein
MFSGGLLIATVSQEHWHARVAGCDRYHVRRACHARPPKRQGAHAKQGAQGWTGEPAWKFERRTVSGITQHRSAWCMTRR